MVQHLLHGILTVTIHEINYLEYGCEGNLCQENMGPNKFRKRCLGQVKRMALGPRIYATVDLDKARVGRTTVLTDKSSHPIFEQTFRIYCAHLITEVIFTVKDDSPFGAVLIGRAYLPVNESIILGNKFETWVNILDENRKPVPGQSQIQVSLQYVDVKIEEHSHWSRGIEHPNFSGVPSTYFNQREGCRVTLYQDAHVSVNFSPSIRLDGGKNFQTGRCWEDIYNAISDARYFIYIAGWSLYTEIVLVRNETTGIKLGDLLKKKAKDGVKVLLLVWDDRTSVNVLQEAGLMATHDEETDNFFRFSKVHCVLCPRNPDDKRSIYQGIKISTMFTHHQKTVIVDSEIPGDSGSAMRTIVSFVGGIDLCGGRYDTQEHPLFRTLGGDRVHHFDFHQPNFVGASVEKGGPREPWHDVHCKLEGPVAWDVLYNFEQRWQRRARFKKRHLIEKEELYNYIIHPVRAVIKDSETWNVQLFRSIDGGDVPFSAPESGLVSGKNNIIDRGIQDAYINAIRRAKNFIYIENQYFLGSSFAWKSQDIKVEDIGALHLIPRELSLKIVSKIEAGERFTVYIVIPMWPEGIPESASIQAILDWQRRTMEMMYSDVAEALRKKGLVNPNLREYLTFFCLGKREMKVEGEYQPPERPPPNSDYARAQESRRFMIYVHSKMMIVDDEYIIVGSANINQRSMAGSRDSEIAIGAFEPHHLATNRPARGQIFGFRMSLWEEHLGETHEEFHHPESLACIQRLNSAADERWDNYARETFDPALKGHLLRYPVDIANHSGGVAAIPGMEHFPDTKARVLGSKSEFLPAILTT
ncbi:hypothetical protein SLA2020_175680 [Shorea laevis]